jgi:DNA-directed RNA polymerase alpha subunit
MSGKTKKIIKLKLKSKMKDTINFKDMNVSVINAIRRTILQDVPTVVFKNINIKKNTTVFNNEILKQRLSCIPIHIKDLDLDNLKNLKLILNLKNSNENVLNVTTEDFQIQLVEQKKMLSKDDLKKIFPPNSLTKSYILFVRLNPHVSNEIPSEELELTADFGISTARQNGAYNVVSACSYGLTVDPVKVEENWEKYQDYLKDKGMIEKDIEYEKINWMNHDKYKKENCYKNSYDLLIESIGIYRIEELLKKSCEIIKLKLSNIKKMAESKSLKIIPEKIALEHSFDIFLENEGYTIGKLIEYALFTNYFEKEKILAYVGFMKYHPHDEHCVIRVAFTKYIANNKKSNEDNVNVIVANACEKLLKLYKDITESF